ncbi:bidirectional sugar transporter NEC1-like, partial [Olea europaea subsp. europaea]
MAFLIAAHMVFTFGILGNIASFFVYMSPVPTFYKIYKRKSSEGFQSIPYSVALFSAMLYLYYAYLKKNMILLITINSFGCIMELCFLIIFTVYANYESKIYTTKILFLFNTVAMGLIVGCTYSLSEGHKRVTIVGWISSVFSLCVFVAPLGIARRVIKTKNVEYMPVPLSLFLTLSGVVWFFYGLFIKDFFIA